MITMKQIQKTGLCPGCAFTAKKLNVVNYKSQFFQIKEKILKPQSCSFPNCNKLCRLKMSKSQSRHGFVFISKIRQSGYYMNQPLADKDKCITHYNKIRIVTDIARCSAEMNNTPGFRTLLAICMYMGHNIMTDNTLFPAGNIIVDVILMCLKLINLFI